MPTNALTIITKSLQDLTILAQGEIPSPEIQQDVLSRLNAMVAGWRTQYGTVTAVQRTVFPLVNNKQTYTIGLGGDFNVPRPETIPSAALWLNALSAPVPVTSITRSGYAATVAQTAHGYAVGDEVLVDGAVEIAYNGLQTVASVPNPNAWTYAVQGLPVTPATGTITAAPVMGQPVEIPRVVITDQAYWANQLKNMPNSQFTEVYYNPTTPLGTIVLWPKPNTAVNQLILYLQNVFTGFADLVTEYDYPSTPGYEEALQYQLDLRLAVPYGRSVPDDIRALAAQTFGLIKRANNRLVDVPTDAQVLTQNRRFGYNILTGVGG